jgi:16S rRNA G966 N2-methylase RsmD
MKNKAGIQIQSGIWKGKKIPAPDSIKGHAHFTPAILKKAIFGILNSESLKGNLNIQEAIFIDLFSGSGQMGMEAISEGFGKAALFEIERNRFETLRETARSFSSKHFFYFNKDSFRYYSSSDIETYSQAVYFLDLPYSFWESKEDKIKELCNKIESVPVKEKWIFLQVPKKIEWEDYEERTYGNHNLYTKFSSSITPQ